jgi:signal peptidase II
MKKFHNIISIYIAVAVLVLDQVTKCIFSQTFAIGESVTLIPHVLKFTLVYNWGAGFGILQGQRIFFLVFSLIVLGYIVYNWKKISSNKMAAIPLGLLLGGILGNFIDRLIFGYVVDFIDIGVWPIFNVADSAITVGVIWMVVSIWKKWI